MKKDDCLHWLGTRYACLAFLDRQKIKKRYQVHALRIDAQSNIVGFREDVGDSQLLRTYTVEYVENDFFKLFQVGSYEKPIHFLYTGEPIVQYGTPHYRNWYNYRIFTPEAIT